MLRYQIMRTVNQTYHRGRRVSHPSLRPSRRAAPLSRSAHVSLVSLLLTCGRTALRCHQQRRVPSPCGGALPEKQDTLFRHVSRNIISNMLRLLLTTLSISGPIDTPRSATGCGAHNIAFTLSHAQSPSQAIADASSWRWTSAFFSLSATRAPSASSVLPFCTLLVDTCTLI